MGSRARSWVRKLLKETRQEILRKGYEPSKEGPEHDDLGDEMQAAKAAAEAKYGAKVRGIVTEPSVWRVTRPSR